MFAPNKQSSPPALTLQERFLDLLIDLALQNRRYVDYAPARPCTPCCCCCSLNAGSYGTTEDPIYQFFDQRKELIKLTLDDDTRRALWNIVQLHGTTVTTLPPTNITIKKVSITPDPETKQPISADEIAKALKSLEQDAPKQRREQIKESILKYIFDLPIYQALQAPTQRSSPT